jgi:hypothetical protein
MPKITAWTVIKDGVKRHGLGFLAGIGFAAFIGFF